MDLDNSGSLVHVKGEDNDGAIATRLNCCRRCRYVVHSFITLAAVNVCCQEMFSSDIGQFSSGRNFPNQGFR
eukprot:7682206-Heterocapsa_arctica.AAC.1